MTDRTCELCGHAFALTHPAKRYCDERCRKRAERRRWADKHSAQAHCAHCQRMFLRRHQATGRVHRFCSTECQYAAKRGDTPSWRKRRRYASALQLDFSKPHLSVHEGAYMHALDKDPCCYCGAPATSRDHIVARQEGGANGWDNYTAACHSCNGSKGKLPLLSYMLCHAIESDIAAETNTIALLRVDTQGGYPKRRETHAVAGVARGACESGEAPSNQTQHFKAAA